MHAFPNYDGCSHPPVTWFPHFGLVAYNDLLFNTRHAEDIATLHHAIENKSTAKIYIWGSRPTNSLESIGGIRFNGNAILTHTIDNTPLQKLQAWMRTTAVRRTTARNVAFAMVCHSRLGHLSQAACLPDEIVAIIILTQSTLKRPASSARQLSVLEAAA